MLSAWAHISSNPAASDLGVDPRRIRNRKVKFLEEAGGWTRNKDDQDALRILGRGGTTYL